MNESSKSIFSKIRDNRYATRYLVGDGIDIGAGKDALGIYHELFPLMASCRGWDLSDGDAELMQSINDNTFNFIHSAHCLEHMKNPQIALDNWLRILKPNGHLICIVPDEDMYEQGVFPSTFNLDHKHSFTIYKKNSWSEKSINLLDLLSRSKFSIEIKKIELLDATFRYDFERITKEPRFDQTTTVIGECGIEFVLKKLAV